MINLTMTNHVMTRRNFRIALRFLGMAALLAFAGCEGAKPQTSGNAASQQNNPELFTIPQDQMSHIQIVTAEPTTLTRVLRLTGSVAYNGFRTTPVITQVSGP